jgi:hypothetical protein
VQKWHTAERGLYFWLTAQLRCHTNLLACCLYCLPLTTESVASFPCSQNGNSRPKKIADSSPSYTQHVPRNSLPKSSPNWTKNRTLSVFGPTFSVREVCRNIWQYIDRNRHEKNVLFAVYLNRVDLADLGRFIRKPLPFSHSAITTDRNVSHHQ